MGRHEGWNRTYPYFKVQVFDDRLHTWVDLKHSFKTVDAAKKHIRDVHLAGATRIVIVEAERSRRILDEGDSG